MCSSRNYICRSPTATSVSQPGQLGPDFIHPGLILIVKGLKGLEVIPAQQRLDCRSAFRCNGGVCGSRLLLGLRFERRRCQHDLGLGNFLCELQGTITRCWLLCRFGLRLGHGRLLEVILSDLRMRFLILVKGQMKIWVVWLRDIIQ